MNQNGTTELEKLLMRNQRVFFTSLSLFVLICCFIYGLSFGSRESLAVGPLKRTASSFSNAEPVQVGFSPENSEATVERLSLVPSLVISSMGNQMRVNGRKAGMWSVGSLESTKTILVEQEQRWKNLGYVTEGVVTAKRGVLLARAAAGVTGLAKTRLMLTVWRVLPGIRARAGVQTQGFLAEMGGDDTTDLDDLVLPPGIAPRSGGKGGAVVTSMDEVDNAGRAVRTQSVVFSNPGTVADNLDYYRETLGDLGWERTAGNKSAGGPTLYLQKGQQELLLVAAPLKQSSMIEGSGAQIFITVFDSSGLPNENSEEDQ